MLTSDDLMGRALHDRFGQVAGRITAVYRYPSNLDAPWGAVAVTTGKLMFKSTHLVDLRDAAAHESHVTTAYDLAAHQKRSSIPSDDRGHPLRA